MPELSENRDERVVPLRLQRFLARAGVASRRKSEDLMTAGRVRVNGIVVRELGSRVDPLTDVVEVDGRRVHLNDGTVSLMLYKPSGYVTTMSDPQGRPCVASLVPTHTYPGLFPVGRLDTDTTGLLLFTTNGDLGQALLHPSHHVDKHYIALVKGRLSHKELVRLREGVMLDDGMTAPATVELIPAESHLVSYVAPRGVLRGQTVVSLRLHEGRNHQVKRMLAAVGHEVLQLHRDAFGPLRLANVDMGAWRLLTPREIHALEEVAQRTKEH
jgi:23S rRNA pseudouridine2605 synthase